MTPTPQTACGSKTSLSHQFAPQEQPCKCVDQGDQGVGSGDEAGGGQTRFSRNWMPYSRRINNASPGSRGCPGDSGPKARTTTTQKRSQSPDFQVSTGSHSRVPPLTGRLQDLYQDHEMRQRRWLERFAEKCKQDDDALNALRMQQRSACGRRNFDNRSFLDWYKSQICHYQEAERSRKELKSSEARQRLNVQFAQCNFEPHRPLASKSGKGSSSSPDIRQRKEKSIFGEFAAAQATRLAALKRLDEREQKQRSALEREASGELEIAIKETRLKLSQFVESHEGRAYIAERAHSYLELNQGMHQSQALREAQADLFQASDARLREQSAESVRSRVRSEMQQLQLERLKLAWELIQLQRQYDSLVPAHAASQHGFDVNCVERLTREDWYVGAREAATRRILNADICPGVTSQITAAAAGPWGSC